MHATPAHPAQRFHRPWRACSAPALARSRIIAVQCCREERHQPSAWQRAAAAAAGAALSLQACLGPCLPAEAQQPAAPPEGPPSASLAELQLAQRLPPLPSDFPPLPPLTMPKCQELQLPNGLRLFLMEDHEVPAIRGTLLMLGGQRASPPDKVGLATISAGVQRAGGSTAHPESALDEALEDRGAFIEGGASGDAISFGFQCLAEDARDVMGLFAEVVLQPALPQPKLDLYKSQVINVLEHQNDNPRAIPPRELAKLIYGRDSVFARSPTQAQVLSITLDDVRQFLAAWERPDSAVLGVVGDFDNREMKEWVREYFGSWQPAPGQPAKPLPLPNPPLPDQGPVAGKLFLVDVPGATQSSVAVGEPGIQLMDPDDYPLDVLNDVLNSFGGRLFDQIRSREGLAYSVQGGWQATPVDHPGLFLATAETAQPGQLLRALQAALQEATESPPSDEEVARAKDETLNQFVFQFASPAGQLQRLVSYSLLGIPRDYQDQYQRGIKAVTPAQVLQAAQRHLHPSRHTAVVAGDAGKIRGELEALGWPIEELRLDE